MVTETYNSEQGSQKYGHWSQNLLVQNKLVRIIVTKTDASPRNKGGEKCPNPTRTGNCVAVLRLFSSP